MISTIINFWSGYFFPTPVVKPQNRKKTIPVSVKETSSPSIIFTQRHIIFTDGLGVNPIQRKTTMWILHHQVTFMGENQSMPVFLFTCC